MRHIIVDGYNVIRADTRLLSLEQNSLERARDVLVQTLASSPRLVHDQVIVVYDGHRGTRSHVHREQRGRIELAYSARGQTADDVIVSEARRLMHAGVVVVVTNDVALREDCRAVGARVSGSENLLEQMPGRIRTPSPSRDDDAGNSTLSTVKRGNPRRTSRRARRSREVRF